MATPDWGLDNVAEHVVREHACLRFGAQLAERFGLRALMAPTTDYRAYYDALAADPLAPDGDPATPIASAARARFDASTWRAPIEEALARTPRCSAEARCIRSDFRSGPAAETCGSCAWLYVGGRGAPVARCRQSGADGRRRSADRAGASRLRALGAARRLPLCGACCREAYHSVTVSVRDPVVWQEPDLIVRNGHRFEIRREGERCAALKVGAAGRDATLRLHDLREPAPPLSRVRRRRATLPRRPPPGRALRESGLGARRRDDAPRRSICSFRSASSTSRSRRRSNARSGGARGARASCGSCGARSTRARGDRSASACASLVARRGRGARAAGAAARRRARWPAGRPAPRVVVVGSGPAGTWAALRLAEAGVPATILEQGKPVQPRRRDLALVTRGELAPRSNYCFGEGGAGTYSDGKLYTRAKDRDGVAAVIADLVRFGATARDRRRHAPARRLEPAARACSTALREHLGGARRRVSLRDRRHRAARRGGAGPRRARRRRRAPRRRRGAGGRALGARRSTTGPPAAGIALERKPIAVGVRIEHPQRAHRRDPVRRRRRPPQAAARVLRARRPASARARRLQLLHVSGRLDRAGRDRARRRGGQRHEPVAARLAVRELGPRRLGGGRRLRAARRRAAGGDRAAAARSSARRFGAGGGRFRAPAQRLGDFLAGRASDIGRPPPATARG